MAASGCGGVGGVGGGDNGLEGRHLSAVPSCLLITNRLHDGATCATVQCN